MDCLQNYKIEECITKMLKWWRDRNPNRNSVKDLMTKLREVREEELISQTTLNTINSIIDGEILKLKCRSGWVPGQSVCTTLLKNKPITKRWKNERIMYRLKIFKKGFKFPK